MIHRMRSMLGALALVGASAAQATIITFTGGIATGYDGSEHRTDNTEVYKPIETYEEAGFRFQFIGTNRYEASVGDYYHRGNDAVHAHWAGFDDGSHGGLTRIFVARVDGGAGAWRARLARSASSRHRAEIVHASRITARVPFARAVCAARAIP